VSASPRIAVVGAGPWGRNHVRTLDAMGHLVAVVDGSPSVRQSMSDQYPHVAVVATLDDVLHGSLGDEVDAVVVATPASTHADVAIAVMNAGKDVLVEKPITMNVADAQRLVAVADATEQLLMVGHLLLFQPSVQFLKDEIARGTIGTVLSLHQERLNFGRARSVENVLWSLGVHDVAVLLDLVGSAPTEVRVEAQRAITSREDDAYLTMVFANGVHAHLHTAWLWPEKRRILTVVGTMGMLVLDEADQSVTLHRKRITGDLDHLDDGSERLFVGEGEPLRIELTNFVDAIKNRRVAVADGRSALAVIDVLAQADQLLKASGGHSV
jgi:predicted dehydrogenase